MKLIRTEEARPGIRVAKDVTDLRGNLLFKAGTELDAALIDRCRQRSVSHIFIDDGTSPVAAAPGDAESRREAVGRQVDRSFAGTESNPLMAAIRDAAKRHLRSKIV